MSQENPQLFVRTETAFSFTHFPQEDLNMVLMTKGKRGAIARLTHIA